MFFLFFVFFCISSIIFGPIFYFVSTEKQKRYNLFFLVVMIFSFLTILVISPFMQIEEILLLMFLSILVASVSSSGYLFSKTNPENETKLTT
ncbi:hypothetical protein [Psychrobacillus sp. FJAT-21963]|uniref:hypothetical protein n=1 Tax=Psychrobacillus sp. FJAT-21963 TaxID=1712028 RepID=UPI0006F82BD3|nr:hypothetical protein [Psychrobacillus sp. FJAT-21963]KQL35927.1 hypothetical protein AN959_08570 [Psychrobacillus sp. FJAT-21963]